MSTSAEARVARARRSCSWAESPVSWVCTSAGWYLVRASWRERQRICRGRGGSAGYFGLLPRHEASGSGDYRARCGGGLRHGCRQHRPHPWRRALWSRIRLVAERLRRHHGSRYPLPDRQPDLADYLHRAHRARLLLYRQGDCSGDARRARRRVLPPKSEIRQRSLRLAQAVCKLVDVEVGGVDDRRSGEILWRRILLSDAAVEDDDIVVPPDLSPVAQ